MNKLYKYTLTFGLTILSPLLFAQDKAVATDKKTSIFEWSLHNILLILGVLVISMAIIAVFNMMEMMMDLHRIKFVQEHGMEAAKKANMLPQVSLWKRFYASMTKSVPIEREVDIDLGHNYDGIRELDNSLPPWWLYMFYITIVFSFVYLYWYHWSDHGKSELTQYEIQMREGDELKQAYLAKTAEAINENNIIALTDVKGISEGKAIFNKLCISCHLETGGGSVGPNLTDNYWIHGGGIKNMFKTIKYGVPEKGMISWKDQLRPTDIQKVASFILTLHGKNPPGAKAAQGTLYNPEPTQGESVPDTLK